MAGKSENSSTSVYCDIKDLLLKLETMRFALANKSYDDERHVTSEMIKVL